MKPSKKKPKKKDESVPKFTDQELAEAQTRISLFGKVYPESTPLDWTMYEGAGWVHGSEVRTFASAYAQCSYSKKWCHKNQISRTVEGLLICQDEIKANGWVQCKHSDWWTKPEDLVTAYQGKLKVMVSKSFVVAGEYFLCDLSGKLYHRSSRMRIAQSPRYSVAAREEIMINPIISHCDVCGNFYDSVMVARRVYNQESQNVCDPCHNRNRNKDLIRAHNFDKYPEPIYKQNELWRGYDHGSYRRFRKVKETGVRLFGVEVETELNKKGCQSNNHDRFTIALSIKETLGDDFVIIKEDGSLSLNGHYGGGEGVSYAGFEIVTAPADIYIHRSKWPLLEAANGYSELRAWDTETCGMHVHVSKAALTTLQIGRILMLMTHKNNKKFIAKVAGRSENKYCKAYHKEKLSEGIVYGNPEVRNGVEYIQASFHLERNDEYRRQAVNVTNPNTIEFRIFRGTVNPRHIIRNIEFCDAVCSFCHPGSRSIKELADWKNLVHFCAENRKAYPLLVEWMESDQIELLPKRNAYGPKDTRGAVRPVVAELVPGAPKPKDDGGDLAAAIERLDRIAGRAPMNDPARMAVLPPPIRFEGNIVWHPQPPGAGLVAFVNAPIEPLPPLPAEEEEVDHPW